MMDNGMSLNAMDVDKVFGDVARICDSAWQELVNEGGAPRHGIFSSWEGHFRPIRNCHTQTHCLHGPFQDNPISGMNFRCCHCSFFVSLREPLSLAVQELAQQMYPIFVLPRFHSLLVSVRHGYLLAMRKRG